MHEFSDRSDSDIQAMKANLSRRYEDFKTRNLSLDMTRGKPCSEQLDLAMEMLGCIDTSGFRTESGIDCRNYGVPDGIEEAKNLFSRYMGATPDELIIGGNSSLNLMHDTIMRAMCTGVSDTSAPWRQSEKIKFICPSPGYDRHFFICAFLGIEMIPVEMDENGPDMDTVEALVKTDAAIKGIWCVPRYSNPTGIVYSDQVIDRLAGMETRADDFRVFCDNAYAVHHLTDSPIPMKNILSAFKSSRDPERLFLFGSTSKISFAGAGIAMMAGTRKNMAFVKKQMGFQTIGHDKLNQLRHVRFFKNMDGIHTHMKKHAKILKPKFDAVNRILERELGKKTLTTWSRPQGGYFISIDTPDGCAKRVVDMAGQAGVKFTPAGATFPYGKDPRDKNIRIAPSYATCREIESAIELLAICIQLAALEKQ